MKDHHRQTIIKSWQFCIKRTEVIKKHKKQSFDIYSRECPLIDWYESKLFLPHKNAWKKLNPTWAGGGPSRPAAWTKGFYLKIKKFWENAKTTIYKCYNII